MLQLRVEPWMKDGACRRIAREDAMRLFFPQKGELATTAKRICEGCPVKEECLDYALQLGETLTGIWGGTAQKERSKMRRLRRVS